LSSFVKLEVIVNHEKMFDNVILKLYIASPEQNVKTFTSLTHQKTVL